MYKRVEKNSCTCIRILLLFKNKLTGIQRFSYLNEMASKAWFPVTCHIMLPVKYLINKWGNFFMDFFHFSFLLKKTSLSWTGFKSLWLASNCILKFSFSPLGYSACNRIFKYLSLIFSAILCFSAWVAREPEKIVQLQVIILQTGNHCEKIRLRFCFN